MNNIKIINVIIRAVCDIRELLSRAMAYLDATAFKIIQ